MQCFNFFSLVVSFDLLLQSAEGNRILFGRVGNLSIQD